MYGVINYLLQLIVLSCFINITLSSKPHIVVIIADDVGWNDVSFHGSDQISTPNIDALGYNGLFLNRHYSYEVCTPSRAAFLTGKYPLRFGYQGYPLGVGLHSFVPHDLVTLPKALKTLGYHNHLIGKWHLGHSKKKHTPIGYGYDTHFGYWNGYIGYFDHAISKFDVYNGTDLHDQLRPVTDKAGEYATDLFTNRALEVIANHSVEEPLFMVMSHLAGHTGKTISGIDTVLEVHNMTQTNLKYHYINGTGRRMYAEIIERMDESVGKLIEALNDKQMLNNSIIVFFSDNGAATFDMHANSGSNYPLRGIKMTMYEGAVRTPALLFSPLIKQRNSVINSLFHITDWVPTLYTAAGGNSKDLGYLDGINQWDYLMSNEEKEHPRKELLVDIDDKFNYSAFIGHNGRYKLVQHSDFFYNYSGQEGFTSTEDHINKVLSSKTNLNILKLDGYQNINEFTISEMRDSLTVKCGKMADEIRRDIKPCEGICLFDLWSDPCEYYNIADHRKKIVQDYLNKIEHLHKFAVAKSAPVFDERADPRLCNNTWFNWMDTDGCWFDENK